MKVVNFTDNISYPKPAMLVRLDGAIQDISLAQKLIQKTPPESFHVPQVLELNSYKNGKSVVLFYVTDDPKLARFDLGGIFSNIFRKKNYSEKLITLKKANENLTNKKIYKFEQVSEAIDKGRFDFNSFSVIKPAFNERVLKILKSVIKRVNLAS